MSHHVVVTGVGAVTALGNGASLLLSRLTAGETGLAEGEGRCAEFDAEAHLGRRLSKRNARFAQLALVAAEEAVRQAGWSDGLPCPAEDVVCMVGTGLGGVTHSPLDSLGTPLTVPLMMPNSAAASLSSRYGLHGESFAVSGACAAGTQAIGLAAAAIRRGDATAAVVGGAEAALVPLIRDSFAQAGALSPSGRCTPFGAERDGFVMGEGAGILVLEKEETARARGAEILGTVLGYGASSDAHHVTAPAPSGIPVARAIRGALHDAGVTPDDLCYINAHGTGTPLNDAAEIRSLRLALGDPLSTVPLSSTKAAIGHLFGAGGAVEAIITLGALRCGVAPPTYGMTDPDRDLGDLDHLLTARELRPGPCGAVGLSESLGFGGHNAVLVLGAPDTKGAP